VEPQYQDLVLATAFDRNTPDQRAGAAGLAQFLADAAAKASLATNLRDQGVAFDRLPVLATDAAKQWTGSFNPVEISVDGFRRLYEQAF
jgi:alcohol dehydrogenase